MAQRERRHGMDGRCGTRRGLIRAAAGVLAAAGAARLTISAAWAQEGTPCPAATSEAAVAIAEA